MTRQSQCIRCHRWLTGSPSSEVGHHGVAGGSVCSLEHHPAPCPFISESGEACAFYGQSSDNDSASLHHEVSDVGELQQQLRQLRQQQQESDRQMQLLQITNNNLTESHSRLQTEWNLRGGSSVATLTSTTTSSTTRM